MFCPGFQYIACGSHAELKPVSFSKFASVIEGVQEPFVVQAIVDEEAANGLAVVGGHDVPFFEVPFVYGPPAAAGLPWAIGCEDFVAVVAIAKGCGLLRIELYAKGMRWAHATE